MPVAAATKEGTGDKVAVAAAALASTSTVRADTAAGRMGLQCCQGKGHSDKE